MTTPIYDFVKNYASGSPARLHMPGHKGTPFLGCEPLDITEIDGADNLYDPGGIILESQSNAAKLFGSAATLYSTGGSSQSVRAMLYLAALRRGQSRPLILAGRNAHKSFLTAAALLDFDIIWLYPENRDYSLCQCDISPAQLERALREHPNAAAVYLTSPDYLGNLTNIPELSQVCHRHNSPILVDNAHGSYLRFLTPSCHPIDQGADLCCDSAHKSLPVLTGGGYLHISEGAPALFRERACQAMSIFGSTSPSYLILESLDLCNRYLADGYPEKLANTVQELSALKLQLSRSGWRFTGSEPLKLTIFTRPSGYTGPELSALLASRNLHIEYADPDYLVLMPTPETPPEALGLLGSALSELPQRPELPALLPAFRPPRHALTVRQALFAPKATVPVAEAVGEVLASLAVSCPPAVAPAVPGEVLTQDIVDIYRYYGIESVDVVK